MVNPYYDSDGITLYCGDAREIVPALGLKFDACITDPPYAETSLKWDIWPKGWPEMIKGVTNSLWSFGSMRMFWDQRDEFAGWNLAQDIVWEKHNGSGFTKDRFKRVHELACHFYRGPWGEIYHETPTTADATKRTVKRNGKPPHTGDIESSLYTSVDGGPRLQRSVIYARSCHGYAVNETQKPEGIVAPIVEYSVPPGGILIDCFSGSSTTLLVARAQSKRAVGIELRESQCEEAVKRLEDRTLL